MRFSTATVVAFIALGSTAVAQGYPNVYARSDDLYARDTDFYGRDANPEAFSIKKGLVMLAGGWASGKVYDKVTSKNDEHHEGGEHERRSLYEREAYPEYEDIYARDAFPDEDLYVREAYPEFEDIYARAAFPDFEGLYERDAFAEPEPEWTYEGFSY